MFFGVLFCFLLDLDSCSSLVLRLNFEGMIELD